MKFFGYLVTEKNSKCLPASLKIVKIASQSRQNAGLLLQLYELPLPHPQASVYFGSGERETERYTLACGTGGGAVPIPTSGQTL